MFKYGRFYSTRTKLISETSSASLFWFGLQDIKDVLGECPLNHSPIRINSCWFEQNGLLLTLNRPSVTKILFEEISGIQASYGNTQVFKDKVRTYKIFNLFKSLTLRIIYVILHVRHNV